MHQKSPAARSRTNFLYGNCTGSDLSAFHAAIAEALAVSGSLPAELADLFEARRVPSEHGNPDGTPRYMIHPR